VVENFVGKLSLENGGPGGLRLGTGVVGFESEVQREVRGVVARRSAPRVGPRSNKGHRGVLAPSHWLPGG